MRKITLVLFLIHSIYCFSQNNTVNKKSLITSNNDSDLSFLLAGHVYGSPNNSKSQFPSASFIANLDKFNALKPNFFILLGDNYRFLDDNHLKNFKSTLLNKLKMPVFNALGNHDISSENNKRNYSRYKNIFGNNTYFSFRFNSSLFIILDTELSYNSKGISDGSIKDEQFVFLEKTIDEFQKLNISKKNIFICSHKNLAKWNRKNFKETIKPLLSRAELNEINIHLISGDMTREPSNFYMYTDPVNINIKHIHTHISDTKHDNILKCNITQDGKVTFSPIPLSEFPTINGVKSESVKPISRYDNIRWKIIRRLKDQIFYEGIFLMIFIFLIMKIKKYL